MVEELEPDDLETMLDDGEPIQVVDVRRPAGYRSGHIPDSENVPFEQLVTSIEQVSWSDRVVFVCPHGLRSRQAGELLTAYEGLGPDAEVYNLDGGLQAWDGPIAVSTSK